MRLIKGKLLALLTLFGVMSASACMLDLSPIVSSQSSKSSLYSSVREESVEEDVFSEKESIFSEESVEESLQEESEEEISQGDSDSSEEESEEMGSSDEESDSVAPHEHEWGEAEIEVAATCEGVGQSVQTCEICGETEYTEIPALEHDFSVRVVALEATCTVKEWIEMRCSREGCGRFQSYRGEVNPNNHKQEYISYVPSIKATCIQVGWTSGTKCGACKAYVEAPQELGYGDHEEKIVNGESSTCIKQGKTNGVKCALCHEVLTAQENLPLGEHKYYSGSCRVCGKLKPSEGLTFALLDDEKSYKLTGVGSCTDTKVVIPDEYEGLPVTAFGYGAFDNNKTVKEVYVPNTITEIGENAFANCNCLEYVQIPEGVTTIGDSAFSGTYALKSIKLPSTLKVIESSAFYNSSLTSITFPAGLEKIGSYAFSSCGLLTGVNFSNAPAYIDMQAFKDCVSLKSVDVGDNVKGIRKEAFRGCRLLTDVTLGKSVSYIEDDAFYDTMLSRAYFAVTVGWSRDNEYVSDYDLSNPKSAATLLLGRFYTWRRETGE